MLSVSCQPSNAHRRADFERQHELSAAEYFSVYLPWGPDWDAWDVRELLITKYVCLNSDQGLMDSERRIVPCLFYFSLTKALNDSHFLNTRSQVCLACLGRNPSGFSLTVKRNSSPLKAGCCCFCSRARGRRRLPVGAHESPAKEEGR